MSKKQETQKNKISIIGAKQHNLKNLSLSVYKNKITVISGVSGSGKSTLAFDTLYAEGQRRYIESLSSYAKQFLGKIEKPDVEEINGICPAIAIEQKTITKNPRSTVGTTTEIYDFLKLLYARIGKTFSPISNSIVKKDKVDDILKYILNQDINSKILITSDFKNEDENNNELIKRLKIKGYSRLLINNKIEKIKDLDVNKINNKKLLTIIDRIIIEKDIDINRITDSIENALHQGNGSCIIFNGKIKKEFSTRFELDGINFITPSPELFSFNNPYGACKKCEGYGSILGIDKKKVIKDEDLWRMWYVSSSGWIKHNDKTEPLYRIKTATSKDGIIWDRYKNTCIDYNKSNGVESIGRPCVLKGKNDYEMYFSHRKSIDYRENENIKNSYKIGMSKSTDGFIWEENLKLDVIPYGKNDWDKNMREYCHVFTHNNFKYMIYNGNHFGKYGFGYLSQINS